MGLQDIILQALQMSQQPTRPRQVSPISNLPFQSNNVGLNNQLGMENLIAPPLAFSQAKVVDPYNVMTPNDVLLNNYNDYQEQAKKLGLINDNATKDLNFLIDQTNTELASLPNDVDFKTKLLSAFTGFAGGFTGNQQLSAQANQMVNNSRQTLIDRKKQLADRKFQLQTAKTELNISDQNRVKTQLDKIYENNVLFGRQTADSKMSLETNLILEASKNFYNNQIQDRMDLRQQEEMKFRAGDSFMNGFRLFAGLRLDNAANLATELSNNGDLSKESRDIVDKKLAELNKELDEERKLSIEEKESITRQRKLDAMAGNLPEMVDQSVLEKNLQTIGKNKRLVDMYGKNKGKLGFGRKDVDDAIEKVAAESGIPPYVFYAVAYQESSTSGFNNATSPKGAKGVFQFIPSTGKQYGLNSESDFRDPVKNAQAFASYYKDLEKRYKGDRVLMLAEYNGGINAVNGIRNMRDGGKRTKFVNGKATNIVATVPEETAKYIPLVGGAMNGYEEFATRDPKMVEAIEKNKIKQMEEAGKALEENIKFIETQFNDILYKPAKEIMRDVEGNEVLDRESKVPLERPLSQTERWQRAKAATDASLIRMGYDISDPNLDPRIKNLYTRFFGGSEKTVIPVKTIVESLMSQKKADQTMVTYDESIANVISGKTNIPKEQENEVLIELVKLRNAETLKNYDVKKENETNALKRSAGISNDSKGISIVNTLLDSLIKD